MPLSSPFSSRDRGCAAPRSPLCRPAERPPSHRAHPPSLKLSHHPSPSPPFIAFKPFTFPSPWQCLTHRGLTPAPPAVATPNSVLNEEAFKGLRDFSALDSGDEEEDVGKEVVGYESNDDKNNLAITNLGLLQPLVDSLFKRGITHIFLIQCRSLVRIRGTTTRANRATSQQLMKAITIPTKKVEKLDMKRPNCKRVAIYESKFRRFRLFEMERSNVHKFMI